MAKRLTIKDIARLSGSSKSTVSRVLNRQGEVHHLTRQRIETVIKQYHFEPSRSARSMRVSESRVVGIILARLDSAAENQAVSAMLPLLYRQGYDVMVLESRFSTRKVAEHLRVLKRREVDGVILFGFTGLTSDMLSGWEHNMVLMVDPYEGFSSVSYDDAAAVNLLVSHLYSQGHRQIRYLGISEDDKTTGGDRYHAYLQACQRLAISPMAALGSLDYQSGYSLAGNLCTPETTALICATDTLALGVCKYLREHPEHCMTVAAIGNTPLLAFLFPDIVMLEFGYATAGKLAARQLIRHLTSPCPPQQYRLKGKLTSPF